ncbi:MAG: branched-chain amino acid transport system II carrier protein, partial [Enterobacteriaceae bacterium]|nr:branched-chain amino acid transport system II carrier protein [Enterobacteriaceae bacterium]
GFILLSNKYKNMLKEIPIENILISISQITLGKFGGVFICICLSFACLATALALTQVSKTYLYEEIFKKKVPNFLCLSIIIIITFTMSHLKFQNLMNLTIPILEIFYPTLITICIMNILFKLKNVKTIKIPVLVTIILSFLFAYIY